METIVIGLGVMILAVLALGAAQTVTSELKVEGYTLPAQSRILLIGDSLGVGLESYLRTHATSGGHTFEALVKSGAPVRYWTPRLLDQRGRHDLWVVVLGANDAVGDAHAFAQDVRDLCAVDENVEIVWLMPTGQSKLRGWQRVADELRVAPVTILIEDCTPDVSGGDGVHPSGQQYALWARCVWRRITSGE